MRIRTRRSESGVETQARCVGRTIGSLFSGIGGLELGLERAGVGRTVWQVEASPFRRAILAKHWPAVTRFDDVKRVGSYSLSPVDVICGGFPCQDISSAGSRSGLAGARSGLWFEYLRIVSELRPTWVVVENVASGAVRWVDTVCAGLEESGYACLPIPLEAADVGAPHERRRVFIVAANSEQSELWNESGWQRWLRWEGTTQLAVDREARFASDAHVRAQSAIQKHVEVGSAQEPTRDGGFWRRAIMPAMVRMAHGISSRLDNQRIEALGDSVVPQCAEVVGYVMRELSV